MRRHSLSILSVIWLIDYVAASSDQERLIGDILKDYQKLVRPVRHDNMAVIVKFGLSLQDIAEFDEEKGVLHTNVWMYYDWSDYKLRWNANDYGGITSMRLPPELIWIPDITLLNSDWKDVDKQVTSSVVFNSEGNASWVVPAQLRAICLMNMEWFPFDTQKCIMKFASWTYNGDKIDLQSKFESIDLSTYIFNSNWDLIDASSKRSEIRYDCCPEPYHDVTFSLTLRRRPRTYYFNLILPCALFSVLLLFVFILPPGQSEKIILGIAVLLLLSMFQLYIIGALIKTYWHLPFINIFVLFLMGMCTISIVASAIVLNLYRRTCDIYEMPNWAKKLLSEWLAKAMCVSRPVYEFSQLKSRLSDCEAATDDSNVRDFDNPTGSATNTRDEILRELRLVTRKIYADVERSAKTNHWKVAAIAIDRLFLCLFVISFLIAAVSYFAWHSK